MYQLLSQGVLLRRERVPESTNDNPITVASFLRCVCFFHGVLLGNEKCFFLFSYYTENGFERLKVVLAFFSALVF